MTTLRPYQHKAIEDLRTYIRAGHKRIILCAPTGAGKTVMFTSMVQGAMQKGKRCIIFTDRVELLRQSDGSLAKFDIRATLIEASNTKPDTSGQCYIAMAQTFSRRKDKQEYINLMAAMDLVIIDEAHKQTFNGLLDLIPEMAVVIGATATPMRRGNQTCLSKFYTALVAPVQVSELVADGYLSCPVTYGTNIDLSGIGMRGDDYDTEAMAKRYSESKIFEGVIQNYQRLTDGRKAIVFASNIASSQEICYAFKMAGYDANHVDGEMSKTNRAAVLNWFKNSHDGILCNCDLMTTGYDEPTIEVVILYRATASLPLFMQMVGRGSRVTDTKKTFAILDFGNNVNTHGHWENDRIWSLKKKKKKKGDGVAPVKNCQGCDAIIQAQVMTCPHCGYVHERKEKKPGEAVELHLLSKGDAIRMAQQSDIFMKAQLAKAKVIKPAWVLHNLRNKEEAMLFVKLLGYSDGWLFYNRARFKVFNL